MKVFSSEYITGSSGGKSQQDQVRKPTFVTFIGSRATLLINAKNGSTVRGMEVTCTRTTGVRPRAQLVKNVTWLAIKPKFMRH